MATIDDERSAEAQLAKLSAESEKLMAEASSIKTRSEMDQPLAAAQLNKYFAETEKLRAEAKASKDKSDAEKELSIAQVAKLNADVEKVRAEAEAVKKFWRPESFTFTGAIVVAILGLVGTIYTKNFLDEKASADTARAGAEKAKADAWASVKDAKDEVKRLEPTIAELRQQAASMGERAAAALNSLITQNERLQKVTEDVTKISRQRDVLEKEVAIAPIVEFIGKVGATARFLSGKEIVEQLSQLDTEHFADFRDHLVLLGRYNKSEHESEKRMAESRRDQIVAAWSDKAASVVLRVWLMETAMRITYLENRELRLRAKTDFLRFCRDGFFVPRTRMNARAREEQQIIWNRLASPESGPDLDHVDLQALYNDLAASYDLAHMFFNSDEPSESLVALLKFTNVIRLNGTSDGQWASLWAKIVNILLRRFLDAKGGAVAVAAEDLRLAMLREPLILIALFQHKERDAALEIARREVLDLSLNERLLKPLSPVEQRRLLSLRDSISARNLSTWKADNSDRVEFWRKLTESTEPSESHEGRSMIMDVTRHGYIPCASEFKFIF